MTALIGLTGGIASGKSEVARVFREIGLSVIDADRVARDVVEPGTPGHGAVVARFGAAILSGDDGQIDRAALREAAFADPAAKRDLDALLHPLIAERTLHLAAERFAAGAAIVVYEASLIYETHAQDRFAAVVGVRVSPLTQLRRLLLRPGMTEATARAIAGSQRHPYLSPSRADYVIDNEGSRAALVYAARKVGAALKARFAA